MLFVSTQRRNVFKTEFRWDPGMQFKTSLCRHNSGDEAFLLRDLILLRVTEGTIFAKLRDHHLLSKYFLVVFTSWLWLDHSAEWGVCCVKKRSDCAKTDANFDAVFLVAVDEMRLVENIWRINLFLQILCWRKLFWVMTFDVEAERWNTRAQ